MSPLSTSSCNNSHAMVPGAFIGEDSVDRLISWTDGVKKNKLMQSFLVGSLSGTCSTLLFQPLDLIKTRMQSFSSIPPSSTSSQLSASQDHKVLYKKISMIKIIGDVIKQEKIIGLWKGTIPSLARCVPGVGIYFGSLNYLSNLICLNSNQPKPMEALIVGFTARSFAVISLLPVTVIKTRYESGLFSYETLGKAFRSILITEGIQGLFRGLLPTLARDAPYSGLFYLFYSQLKISFNVVNDKSIKKEESLSRPSETFAYGLAAGIAASLLTHPADVIKTRMQVEPKRYSGLRKTIVITIKNQEIFRGLAPRIIRRALMSAFTWTIFESLIQKIGLK